ncbi:MAG: hypothetical protein FJY92_11625 [Candidatus Hydrogenedentes bacterium]|nr:hypothetical protein [Candidatus Hydrogenedentota bacterium]
MIGDLGTAAMQKAALLVIATGAGVYALHRMLLWMERRGWIYYWHKRGSGNVGNILMPIQAIYQPEIKYTIEERARADAEEDDQGDPPFPNEDAQTT